MYVTHNEREHKCICRNLKIVKINVLPQLTLTARLFDFAINIL